MATNPRIAQVERATGRPWSRWRAFLDSVGAADLDHPQIVTRVHTELAGTMDSAGWWAQSVAVAYEQDIGRRLPGQRSDGTFEMSVSRATPLGMTELMDAWTAFAAQDPAVRDVAATEPRVGGTDKRVTWRTKAPDGSGVIVTSEPRKGGAASIVATQTGVATPEENEAARARWTATMTRFLEGVAR